MWIEIGQTWILTPCGPYDHIRKFLSGDISMDFYQITLKRYMCTVLMWCLVLDAVSVESNYLKYIYFMMETLKSCRYMFKG